MPGTMKISLRGYIQSWEENSQRKIFSLFHIAYKIAKYGKPFTDFEIDCQQNKKLEVDLGKNYLNTNRCKDFI